MEVGRGPRPHCRQVGERHSPARVRQGRRGRREPHLLLDLPDAFLDSGIVNFLHLGFAQCAITGVLDAIRNVVNIGADALQQADQGMQH